MADHGKVGLASALRARELAEEDAQDQGSDWDEGEFDPDSPKKRPAPPPPRPASKEQPSAAGGAEKRTQSELDSTDEPGPCDSFALDLTASEFGSCRCGFKKSDHASGARLRSQPKHLGDTYHPPPKIVESRPDEDDEPQVEACMSYEIDMSAKEFGTCKCGQKKTAHSRAALNTPPKPRSSGGFASVQAAEERAREEKRKEAEEKKRQEEQEARSRQEFLEREKQIASEGGDAIVDSTDSAVGAAQADAVEEPLEEQAKACEHYEVDLNASGFGTCKCGFKKMDHSKAALVAGPAQRRPSRIGFAAPPQKNQAPPAFATAAAVTSVAAASVAVAAAVQMDEPEPEPEPEPAQLKVEPEPAYQEPAYQEPVQEPVLEEQTEIPMEEAEAPEEEQPLGTMVDPPELYRAIYDFDGQEDEDLPFNENDIIEVFEIIDADWMKGRLQGGNGTSGVFPTTYVERYEGALEQAAEDDQPVQEEQEAHQMESEPEPVYEQEAEPEYQQTQEPEPVHYQEPEPEPEPTYEQDPQPEPVFEQEAVQTQEPEPELEPEAVAEEADLGEGLPFTAYALYEFVGETEQDLSLKEGDVIEVVEIVDDLWWRGKANGQEGIFPVDFVSREMPQQDEEVAQQAEAPEDQQANAEEENFQEQVPAPEEETFQEQQPDVPKALGFVMAEFDFAAESEGDLGFYAGERIEVLEFIDENWMRGAVGETEGMFPKDFVSEIEYY